jgi:hypothetical protein
MLRRVASSTSAAHYGSFCGAENFQDLLRPHPYPVVISQSPPGNPAVGFDEEDRGPGDGAPAWLGSFVHQPPRSYRLPLYVRQDLELEIEFLREARVFFDGVDRDRDDLGAGRVDVFDA